MDFDFKNVEIINITVNMKIPKGEYCYPCKLKRLNGYTKKTECLMFDKPLKEVRIKDSDFYLKCKECFQSTDNYED